MGKSGVEDELNCGACGYATCREHAIAISEGLAESEMCLPYMIEELSKTCDELTSTNSELATTQQALVQAEKLASMGQLAAGIAHEVNNPLSTVLMLSNVLLDEANENPQTKEDLTLIVDEATRCKTIVSGLLQFARKNKVDAAVSNIRELIQRTVRALPPHDGVEVLIECPESGLDAEVDPDQFIQVLTNLSSNALAAMPDGGALTIKAHADETDIHLVVSDTGTGIAEENRRKIFEPFFTTKPAGQGTGLGLSITYGIVKMHHGDITVESNTDPSAGPTGTTFTIRAPLQRSAGSDALVA